jgi:DNA-nicking Smr family endonuclease
MPLNPSKEDLALWQAIIEKVKPLPQEESPPNTTPRKKKIRIEQKSKFPIPSLKDLPLESFTRQQLRNHPVEARLDLHGYTQTEAYDALVRFIHANYLQQRRALLIITGKGKEGKGVLKQELSRWLGTDALKDKILAAAPARPEDGGVGACYVLLRRMR